jgi:hypothetical protein
LVKIVIPGNCQAQLLESMVMAALPGAEVTRLEPNYMMTEAHKSSVMRILRDADHIFAQRTSRSFYLDWLTPRALRETFPGKCLIWPNIYFDGNFPDTHYIYKGELGKILSPLEDYHLRPLVDAWRAGAGVAEAVAAFESSGLAFGDPFEASFAQLELREQDVDVKISDFLREKAPLRRCVYTPNHPYNDVLALLGARLAASAGLDFDREAAAAIPYRLDRVYLPTFPAIVRGRSLPYDNRTRFRGVEIADITEKAVELGGPREYTTEELVRAFWKIYDKFAP